MIDWLTLKLERPDRFFQPHELETLCQRTGKVLAIDSDGAVQWIKNQRESIRSDSHQIVVDYNGRDFQLHGSPARVVQVNNVFGSGDILECFGNMVAFAALHLHMDLPTDPKVWKCTRVDYTHNYDLGGGAEVQEVLGILRVAERRGYKPDYYKSSVYWGMGSSLMTMKAYHKGPHLEYQHRKQQATATLEEIFDAQRLLRLELSLKGQYWRERAAKPWYQHTETDLDLIHDKYFSQVIGSIEVSQMDYDIKHKIIQAAPTPGRGESAFRTWMLIRQIGYELTKQSMNAYTFRNHLIIMKTAGLSEADLRAGVVIPLRRKPVILGNPVKSWNELRAA